MHPAMNMIFQDNYTGNFVTIKFPWLQVESQPKLRGKNRSRWNWLFGQIDRSSLTETSSKYSRTMRGRSRKRRSAPGSLGKSRCEGKYHLDEKHSDSILTHAICFSGGWVCGRPKKNLRNGIYWRVSVFIVPSVTWQKNMLHSNMKSNKKLNIFYFFRLWLRIGKISRYTY